MRLATASIALAAALVAPVRAGTLGTGQLLVPLAPGAEPRLRIFMQSGVAPDQPMWVVYDLVALSPDDSGKGRTALEGSIEGVITPANDMLVTFRADEMESGAGAGTAPEHLAKIAGERSSSELQQLMGSDMYAAYQAFNAGSGRVLTGRIVRHLPPPDTTEAIMLVSVERTEGMQPLSLQVAVGQGELPDSMRPAVDRQWPYRLGRIAGGLLFLWLLYRLFSRKRRQQAGRRAD